jgi:hypothetical protein
MEIRKSFAYHSCMSIIQKTDWKLLAFLLLFLNVKLIVKLFGIALMYAMERNFRFGFSLRSSRLPLFYLIVIGISVVNLFLYKLFTDISYDLVFMIGIGFWTISIFAIHQLKLFAEKLDAATIENTLITFFVINALFSLANLAMIIIETGAVNPFQYQGMFQKYFICTGDYIKGITFDTSTTNALLNAFGIIYFLRKNKPQMVLLCMCVLLLTGSNLVNAIIISSLLFIFIFKSTREQKSIISICIFLFAIFMARISPQNNEYAAGIFIIFFRKEETKAAGEGSFSAPVLTHEQEKQRIAKKSLDSQYSALQQKGLLAEIIASGPRQKPALPRPDINRPEYQARNDTSPLRKALIDYSKLHYEDSIFLSRKDDWQKKSGKLISMQQTISFFKQHPRNLITGDGIGRFSSKLAFRAAALNLSGAFPEKLSYMNNDFSNNHLALLLYFLIKQKELHSVTNTPDSVYNQVLGEYGLAGIAALIIFFIGFFFNCSKSLIQDLPFLYIIIIAFASGYWFEQLSIVPFFEFLMFMNRKVTNLNVSAS